MGNDAQPASIRSRLFSRDHLLVAAVCIIVVLSQLSFYISGRSFVAAPSTPPASLLRLTSLPHAPARTAHAGRPAASWQLDTQCGSSQPGATCALFILYSWNYDMFWSTLQSYVAGGLGHRTIIIDNSVERRVFNDAKVAALVGEIIPTRVQLTFSQLQNFMADVAIERNLTYYFWGHADVAVLATNASASFADEVTGCVGSVMAQEPLWGIVFFGYDLFAAFRTDVVRQVRFDNFIHHYLSDCDYYARVRAHGWRIIDHYKHFCPDVDLQVFDMKRPLVLPLHNYEKAKEVLQGEEGIQVDRNDWRRKQWTVHEQVGFDSLSQSSRLYYRMKWGIEGEEEDECGYPETVINNSTGERGLRQQPFETYERPARRHK